MAALKPVLLVALICGLSYVIPGNSQLCSDNVDLTVIIDSSVRDSEFEQIRGFLHDLMDGQHIELSFGTTRVNYLQYADTFILSGGFLTSSRRTQTTIDDMQYLDGTARNTAGALDYYINNRPSSDRAGNQNVVILLIAGPSAEKASAIASAETIHNRGDDILVIGVTSAVDVDEIKRLTSSPRVKGQNYFQVSSFTELGGTTSTVANGLCNRDQPAPETTTTTAAPTTTTATTTPSPKPDTTTPSQKTSTDTQPTPKPSSGRPVVTLTYTVESTEATTSITTTTEVPPISTVLLIAIIVPVLITLMIIIAVIICCCRGCACYDTEVGCVCGQIHCTEAGADCVTSCCGSCCWIKETTQKKEKSLTFSSVKASEEPEDAVTTPLEPEKT